MRFSGEVCTTEYRAVRLIRVLAAGTRGSMPHAQPDADTRLDTAEQLMHETEQKYRAMFELSPEAITIVDRKGKLLEVNSKVHELLGYEPKEIIGKNLAALPVLSPLSRVKLVKTYFTRMLGKEVPYADFEFTGKSGEVRIGRIKPNLLRNRKGRIIGELSIIFDVTDQRRAEGLVRVQRDLGLALGAARGLNETLRLCVEAAIRVSEMDSGGVYLVDRTSGKMDLAFHTGLSSAFVEATSHYAADSTSVRLVLAGKPVYALHQELGVPLSEVQLGEGLRAAAVIPVRHDGGIVGCLNVASHTRDEIPGSVRIALEAVSAQVGGVIIRSRAEEALRESEQRLQAMWNAVDSGIAVIDAETHEVLDVNSAAVKMIGASRDEIVGRVCHKHIGSAARGRCPITDLGQTVDNSERVLLNAAGEKVPVLKSVVRLTLGGRDCLVESFIDISDRKRAEQELRESEERLSIIFERGPDACYLIDRKGRFVEGNRAAEEMIGYEREELIGKSFFKLNLLAPSQMRKAAGLLAQSMLGKPIGPTELTLNRKDSSQVDVELRSHPVTIKGERMVLGIARDITDRKRNQQAIRESEEKYRTVFEFSPVAIAVLDRKGKLLDVNERMPEWLGYRREEVLGKALVGLPFLTRRSKVILVKNFVARMLGKDIPPYDVEFVTRDGQTRIGRIQATPLRDEKGKITGDLAMISDVTEVKRAEEEVRAARVDLENVFRSIDDMTIVVDREYTILRTNDTARRWLEVGSDEVLTGRKCYEVFHGRAAVCPDCPVVQAFASGEPVRVEKFSERVQRFLSVSASPVVGEGGKVVKVLEVARDITEQKRTEEALEEKRQELERSNQELEQFAYVASHDLQEPLRMIGSYTQLLARRYQGKLDKDADEFIGFAVDGVTRMQRLINDLLTYSRVGTRGREPEPTDSNVVLERALLNLQVAIEDNKAKVTHDPLPVVMADDRQLEQLLQNLVGNALKYHGKEPPCVHVGVAQSNGTWEFFVRDNGIGIDPKYADRVFVIFQRLHNRTEYSGTGIGLAVCKKIVERHGGRIWMESEPGKGSTFRFTLPVKGEKQT